MYTALCLVKNSVLTELCIGQNYECTALCIIPSILHCVVGKIRLHYTVHSAQLRVHCIVHYSEYTLLCLWQTVLCSCAAGNIAPCSTPWVPNIHSILSGLQWGLALFFTQHGWQMELEIVENIQLN